MIRTRLTFAFALLALLAMIQGAFTVWASRSAADRAKQSVVSAHLLNQYLDLSANKQRLKVWFAQSALADDAPLEQRELLLNRMAENLAELENTAQRLYRFDIKAAEGEIATAAALKKNFAALSQEIIRAGQSNALAKDASSWRALIAVFDISEGVDMRQVLGQAVTRQRQASETAERELEQALARVQSANTLLTALSVGLGIFAVLYFVRRMQRPFQDLVQATTALAHGDYSQRPVGRSQDEFGQFGDQLNILATQLQTAQEHNQRLMRGLDDAVAERTNALTRSHEALMRIDSRRRQFFAELSHELRTPVTVIRGEAEIALRGYRQSADTYRASLQTIVSTAADMGARVEDLLHAARSDTLDYAMHLKPTPVDEIVSSVLQKLSAIAAHRQISVVHDLHLPDMRKDNLWVMADKDRLSQALMIVLDNAIRYSPAGSQVKLQLKHLDDELQLAVRDEGIGMSDEELSQAFDRHFRGSQARSLSPTGAGLGLTIARDILTAHHGHISLEPQKPRGLQVNLHLPALKPDEALLAHI
jgi:two-component system, OmpR family, sensor kinase